MIRTWVISSILIMGLFDPILPQTWHFFTVDSGVKPALDLDSGGIPHISCMLEDHNGFVKHAIWNPATSMFDAAIVSTGYFYGPLDMALDQDGFPHINYHNHTFEDQVHAYLTTNGWVEERIQDPGHDGWDNSIVLDGNNYPHTSTIQPTAFGGVGVEYAFFNGATWQVEAIGYTFVDYANTTSLALDSEGKPHITFYDDKSGDLIYAVRDMSGWNISAVDTEGDVGRFSSLYLDASDVPHISYYQHLGGTTGVVKFAVANGLNWNIATVDSLGNVVIGFSGARNITSLDFDSQGLPHISYSDEKILKHAFWDGAIWQTEVVLDVSGTSTVLGQLTSMKLDGLDLPHIAYFEVTSKSPLTGVVKYATQKMATSVSDDPGRPAAFDLMQNYPNPFNPQTTIQYELTENTAVSLKIYNLLGQEVRILVSVVQTAGMKSIVWNGKDDLGRTVPSGIYFYRLQAGLKTDERRMLFLR